MGHSFIFYLLLAAFPTNAENAEDCRQGHALLQKVDLKYDGGETFSCSKCKPVPSNQVGGDKCVDYNDEQKDKLCKTMCNFAWKCQEATDKYNQHACDKDEDADYWCEEKQKSLAKVPQNLADKDEKQFSCSNCKAYSDTCDDLDDTENDNLCKTLCKVAWKCDPSAPGYEEEEPQACNKQQYGRFWCERKPPPTHTNFCSQKCEVYLAYLAEEDEYMGICRNKLTDGEMDSMVCLSLCKPVVDAGKPIAIGDACEIRGRFYTKKQRKLLSR